MASSPARVCASLGTREAQTRFGGDGNEVCLKRYVETTPSQWRSSARRVEVTGSAEFSAAPDRAVLSVSVANSKTSVNEASNSAARRVEYIQQSARQHGVKEEDITVTKHIWRDADLYRLQAEVSMVFSDFEQMQHARCVLLEKLDKSVCVREPLFSHSSECLSLLRRRTCVAAVENARLKANEVCNVLGQTLGCPLLVQEEETREWTCGQAEGMDLPLTLQQKVGHTTVFASSRVFVTFELRPKDFNIKTL